MFRWSRIYLQFFQRKKFVSKVFGPFSLLLVGVSLPFSNSPSYAPYPYIFSQLSTSILTSFFTVFNLLMIIQLPLDNHSQTGVTNLWAATHTWPPLHRTSPCTYREAADSYLQRHPYTLTSTDTRAPKLYAGTLYYFTSTATPTPKLADGNQIQLSWGLELKYIYLYATFRLPFLLPSSW